MRELDMKDFNAFLDEFQQETDRGAALVGAAIIDHRLDDTLRSFMVSNNAASELLEGPRAPLGTFSARVDACFALGLIDAHEKSQCHLIRKIRNEFAHRKHGTTFKDKHISDMCHQLKSIPPGAKEAFAGNPRQLFINSVVLISLLLTYRGEMVAQEKRVARSWSNL